jgi:NADH dehydrogenase [ubiquinone] 1 alpha subcomplex assembly factor 6
MPTSPLSHVARLVQRHDRDRFLTALFAPAERREDLFALYAFNYEVAKTREVVSEATLGRVRLQWWRESIAGIYAGDTPRRHEVIEPLTAAIRRHDLARESFDRLIDARESDLGNDPPESLAALERYVDTTSGGLVLLALAILGGTGNAASAAAPFPSTRAQSASTCRRISRAPPICARNAISSTSARRQNCAAW